MVNESTVYAIYPENAALTSVVRTLDRAGFNKERICMMLGSTHPIAVIASESRLRPYEPESNAVTAGLIAWLSEFGAVVIPKFGFFIRSQEFFRALVLERSSSAECGGKGTLMCLGFSSEDARRIDNRVRHGKVLVCVTCRELAQAGWALELLRATGADEVNRLEKTAPLAPQYEQQPSAYSASC